MTKFPLCQAFGPVDPSRTVNLPLGWRLRFDSNWFSSGARTRITKALPQLCYRRPQLAPSIGGTPSAASSPGFPRTVADG
jgi:hypothetical protein